MFLLYLLFVGCCTSVLAEWNLTVYVIDGAAKWEDIDKIIEDIEDSGTEQYPLKFAKKYFDNFTKSFGKTYKTEEEKVKRFDIFKDNLAEVNRMNSKSGSTGFGITKYLDYTKDEFRTYFTGFSGSFYPGNCIVVGDDGVPDIPIPDFLDWRRANVVTKVKNQGVCGSCYTFATTGVLEGQHALKNGELLSLSEQQIVDCDHKNNGCGRGFMTLALRGLMENGGIQREVDYPYIGRDDTICRFNRSRVVVQPTQCYTFRLSTQRKIQQMLYAKGPIAIAVRGDILQYYRGGHILQNCYGEVNHAVLLVGYGMDGNQPYWIVKNSYGNDWGEYGYYRVSRWENNESCGMRLPENMVSADVAPKRWWY